MENISSAYEYIQLIEVARQIGRSPRKVAEVASKCDVRTWVCSHSLLIFRRYGRPRLFWLERAWLAFEGSKDRGGASWFTVDDRSRLLESRPGCFISLAAVRSCGPSYTSAAGMELFPELPDGLGKPTKLEQGQEVEGPFNVILPSKRTSGDTEAQFCSSEIDEVHFDRQGAESVAAELGGRLLPTVIEDGVLQLREGKNTGGSRAKIGGNKEELHLCRERTFMRIIGALVLEIAFRDGPRAGKTKARAPDRYVAELSKALELRAKEYRRDSTVVVALKPARSTGTSAPVAPQAVARLEPLPPKFGLGDDTTAETMRAGLAAIIDNTWRPEPK